jgi:uncharacterized membrane protein YkgB
VLLDRLLRWSLGLVYVWFGALKLVGMSTVVELVRSAYPGFSAAPLYCALALFELAIGLALLVGLWTRWAAGAAVLHLLGTFGLFFVAPRIAFLPIFPFLTLEGEFVLKNLVLLAAAVAIWSEGQKEVSAGRKRLRPALVAALAFAAVALGFAGTRIHESLRATAQKETTGAPPLRLTASTIDAITGEGATQPIHVEGVVVDRCRLLGCWLKLRDRTGDVFVDLAQSALSARGIPLGSRLSVTGLIGRTREGKVGFIASQLKAVTSQLKPLAEAAP